MKTINAPSRSWLQLSGDADRLNRLQNRPWSSTLPRLIDTMLLINLSQDRMQSSWHIEIIASERKDRGRRKKSFAVAIFKCANGVNDSLMVR